MKNDKWKMENKNDPVIPFLDFPRLCYMRALSFHVHRVKRLAGSHEQAVSFRATEADVAARLRQKDLPNPLAIRREDVNAIIACASPTGGRPDIAILISSDSIRTANHFPVFRFELHRSEFATIAQPL